MKLAPRVQDVMQLTKLYQVIDVFPDEDSAVRSFASLMTCPAPLKTTALARHARRMGAKMVDFGGWDMPLQYSGILEEHARGSHRLWACST